MCQTLCGDPAGPHHCPECGRLLCYDLDGAPSDDRASPPVVYDAELLCDRCAKAFRDEDDEEDEWDEFDDEDDFDEDEWEDDDIWPEEEEEDDA